MGAGAVEVLGYVVAGAVGEVVGESGGADYGAGCVVGLEAADGAVGGEGLLDSGDGCVAGGADYVEYLLLAGGGLAADDAGPGDVVKDAGGLGRAGPDVDEEEVAVADGGGVGGGGLVVGVGGVGVDADVGAVVEGEAFAAHGFSQPDLEVVFGEGGGVGVGGAEG